MMAAKKAAAKAAAAALLKDPPAAALVVLPAAKEAVLPAAKQVAFRSVGVDSSEGSDKGKGKGTNSANLLMAINREVAESASAGRDHIFETMNEYLLWRGQDGIDG